MDDQMLLYIPYQFQMQQSLAQNLRQRTITTMQPLVRMSRSAVGTVSDLMSRARRFEAG